MRTVCFTLFLILSMVQPGLAASFNFSASEQYVIRNEDEVVFTLVYDRETDPVPDRVTMELDYDGDGVIDRTVESDSPEKRRIEMIYGYRFEHPGVFEARAFFRITYPEGMETKTLDFNIFVANWKFDANACINSTPALSPEGDTVYVGSGDGYLYARHAEDGSYKWEFWTGGEVNSSPAVDSDGYIYFGSEDGHVYCLEPEDGALQWEHRAGGLLFSSPALDQENNRLYIGSTDNHLYALNLKTGERDWRFRTGSNISSSPVVGHDGTVYVGSQDNHLYAIAPDGRERWRFDAEASIFASPALDRDGTIFFSTSSFRGAIDEKNGLWAVSSAGREKWFVQNKSGFGAAPVIDSSGILCVGSYDNKLYGIHRSGGRLIMYKTFSDDVISSPALGSNGYLYSGSRDGMFFALDLDKGDERSGRNEYWRYDLGMPIASSSPVIGNGYVYVGTCKTEGDSTKGVLFSFSASGSPDVPLISPADSAPWPQARNRSDNNAVTAETPATVAPEVSATDPEPGTVDFDLGRWSISATFSMPMDPESIYDPPGEDNNFEGYYGFTVEPFDSPKEDFAVTWNDEQTVFTLTLPDEDEDGEPVSFEPGEKYTARILSGAHSVGEPNRTLLYSHKWSFSRSDEESGDNSHSPGCFISTMFESLHF